MLKPRSSTPAMRGFGGNTQFRTPALAGPGAAAAVESAQELGWSVMLLGFYTLTLIVPIAELIIVYLHVWIPVVWIADAILTVLLLTTGRIGAFWRANAAKPWMIMLVLFSAAAVLGMYPGRSVPFIFSYGLRFHIYPFYACALALNTRQVRHAIAWIGSGSFVILLLCIVFGEVKDGRLIIPDTDFSNPNDLGLGILLAMGALVVFRSKIARGIAIACLPLFVMEILRTGSRACLVTLIALLLMLFMLVSSRTKILLAAVVPIAAAVIVVTMPSFTLSRLTLIVADTSSARTVDDQELADAIGSQAARTELQKRALELAFHNPILGVGATNLEDAIDDMVRNLTGKKSGWQGAHNTYLEVAGENGFPAAILYIVAVVMTIRLNDPVLQNLPQRTAASARFHA